MKPCPKCGCLNDDTHAYCGACGSGLSTSPRRVVVQCGCGEKFYATENQVGKRLRCVCGSLLVVGASPSSEPPPLPNAGPRLRQAARPASRALVLTACGFLAICGTAVIAEALVQNAALSRLRAHLDQETISAQRDHDETVRKAQEAEAAEIAAQQATLAARLTNPALLSGELARQRHEKEWDRRLAHDPALAGSAMEKTLLSMEKVGRDPGRSAQEALAEVARLAAPRGSRIEITPNGDLFEVKVAFRMSALSAKEAGAVTKHHSTESMRREIRALSATVMKSLFDYCGSRGIEKLSVTCNHAMHRTLIPDNATAWEKSELLRRAPVVFGRLYRTSLDRQAARGVSDWRRISVSSVTSMMRVELDGLNTLEITGVSANEGVDPEGPLEF